MGSLGKVSGFRVHICRYTCVYIYTYVYMYTYMYTYMYLHIYIYIYIYIYMNIHAFVYVYENCMHVYIYIYVYLHTYIMSVCVCIYINTYICTHIYIYMYTCICHTVGLRALPQSSAVAGLLHLRLQLQRLWPLRGPPDPRREVRSDFQRHRGPLPADVRLLEASSETLSNTTKLIVRPRRALQKGCSIPGLLNPQPTKQES